MSHHTNTGETFQTHRTEDMRIPIGDHVWSVSMSGWRAHLVGEDFLWWFLLNRGHRLVDIINGIYQLVEITCRIHNKSGRRVSARRRRCATSSMKHSGLMVWGLCDRDSMSSCLGSHASPFCRIPSAWKCLPKSTSQLEKAACHLRHSLIYLISLYKACKTINDNPCSNLYFFLW